MSFDVHMHTCNLGNKKAKVKDPFTGRMVEMFADKGLTASERKAVVGLLADARATGPDEQGCYVVEFDDGGGAAEVFMDNLIGSAKCDGGMLAIRDMSPKLSEFVFDLARLGNMLLTVVIEETPTIVTSPQQKKKIIARFPDAEVIGTAKELHTLVTKGFKAWKRFRNHVVKT